MSFVLLLERSQMRKLLSNALVLAAATAALVTTTGCPDDPEPGGIGASCESGSDCRADLSCREGVCTDASDPADTGEGGVDATDATDDTDETGPRDTTETGTPDTDDSGADSDDASADDTTGDTSAPDVTDAADDGGGDSMGYLISYVQSDGSEADLHLYDPSTGDDIVVTPPSVNCTFGCWLTRNLEYLVYGEDAGGGNRDLLVQSLDDTFQPTGSADTITTGAGYVSVVDNAVTYRDGINGDTVYVRELSADEPETIGQFTSRGRWTVRPQADKAMIFEPDMAGQTLTVHVGDATSRSNDTSFDLGGTNYDPEGGSYFGGNVPATIDRDGEVGAFVTRRSPNDGPICQRDRADDPYSAPECGQYERCGSQGRCVRLETTVHLVDFSNLDNLGSQCSSQGGCGPIHECDIPSQQQLDRARCIPGRVVLGVPASARQNRSTGCEIVEQDPTIDFTGVRGPLSFSADGTLYLVGERNRKCVDNVESDAAEIVAIDPTSDGYVTLAGLSGAQNYEPDRCWDASAGTFDLANCRFYPGRVLAAPGVDELAFSATNPNLTEPQRAPDALHVWRMGTAGSPKWFTGDTNTPVTETVTRLGVHPTPK